MIKYLIFASICLGLLATSAEALRFKGGAEIVSVGQTLVSVTPTTASFAGGTGSANTFIFTPHITMSPVSPAFSGTCTITGADAANFAINSGTCAVSVGASDLPSGDHDYAINVVATQGGATGSPLTQAIALNSTDSTFITTATVQNISGSTVANWPLQRSQSFKFGEVSASEHVEIRVASGSTCSGTLLDYQWDDIATRTENIGDGSWRTATYTVRLPSTVASAYTTIAFCKVAGAYSPSSSSISLADLVAAHPLAMDLTDVANQDGSTRDSGTATMAIADYITTTGREAPVLTANGPIRKSWKIRGEPVYATSGNKDPLLFVEWYIDVYPDPNDAASIQYVRHIARTVNAWMQVAEGTDGTAGATDCNGGACPVGFTDDPQMVSYQPLIRDGATTLIDYGDAFDNTVADATLPSNSVTYQTNNSTGAGGNILRFPNDAVNGGQPPLAGVWYHTRVSNTDHPSSIPAGCQVTDPDILVSGYQLDCTIASPGVSSGDHIKFDTYFTKPDNILGPFTISAMSWASSFGGELSITTSATGIIVPGFNDNNVRLMIVGATNSGTGGNAAINTVFTEWEGNNDGIHWGVQAQADSGVFGTLGFGSAQVYIAAPGRFTDDDQKTGYFQSNASVGEHLYYPGSCFRYTTGGTPPFPMINNKIYYPYTINFFKQPNNGDRFQLTEQSINMLPITPIDTGSGSQTLSYRVCHRHQTGWYTADNQGKSRWLGAASETEPFETTLDQGSFTTERAYFQETGTVPPLELSHASIWATTNFSQVEYSASTSQYFPCSVSLAIGGSGGGSHGYIGIMSEWNARWWLSQDVDQIKQTRIFALDSECYPQTVILNEQNGRIPAVNNGAPIGTGTGDGTPYAELGTAVYPYLNIPLNGFGSSAYIDMAYPLTNVPRVSGGDPIKPLFGQYQGGIYNDHQPAFAYMPPFVFGDRHYLDIIWDQANRTMYVAEDKGTDNVNEGKPNRSFTFPSGSGTPPAGQTFHGMLTFGNIDQQGPRAGAWSQRAITMGAALGADNSAERAYFLDLTKENYNYWLAMKAHKDCTSPVNAATTPYTAADGAWSNSPAATLQSSSNQAFMNMYNGMARYLGWELIRDPYSREQLDGAFYQNVKASLGTEGWPNSTPPSMSAGFYYYQWGDLIKSSAGKCRAAYAGTYLDYGSSSIFVGIDVSNGIWMMAGNSTGLEGPVGVTLTAGDKVKNVHIGDQSQLYVETAGTGGSPTVTGWGPNEMPYDTYYCMVNINNTDRTFMVAPPNPTCDTPGAAITSYTGMVAEGQNYCYAPPFWTSSQIPASMHTATTWFCGFAFNFRTQANNFIGNPGYVYWNGSMAAAVANSGVSAAIDSYNISRAYMPVTDVLSNSVGSAFDWGVTTIPP